jgi:hypothetical protein
MKIWGGHVFKARIDSRQYRFQIQQKLYLQGKDTVLEPKCISIVTAPEMPHFKILQKNRGHSATKYWILQDGNSLKLIYVMILRGNSIVYDFVGK